MGSTGRKERVGVDVSKWIELVKGIQGRSHLIATIFSTK